MVLQTARKLIVLVVGCTVVLLGVVLIFTPGPAMLVIPAGLAILATEFVWARRLLRRIKARARLATKSLTVALRTATQSRSDRP